MKKTIIATANHSQRTFTIRAYSEGKVYAKYRTIIMSQNEFDLNVLNTVNDWNHFLKSSDYYPVK